MEPQEAAQQRELLRFETLVDTLRRQVQDVVSSENGLQGYKSAARLYNRYVEKIDSLLPPNLQGLAETIDVPELDPDDEEELKTFLSELLFSLGQLHSLVGSATATHTEGVPGRGRRHRQYIFGCGEPGEVGKGRHQVHVETRVHRGARPCTHAWPYPIPPMPPIPPIPMVSPMPGVPQEMQRSWRSWLQELGHAHREWYRQFRQAYIGEATAETADEKQEDTDLQQQRRDILAMVESKQLTVEEAMARLEALKTEGQSDQQQEK